MQGIEMSTVQTEGVGSAPISVLQLGHDHDQCCRPSPGSCNQGDRQQEDIPYCSMAELCMSHGGLTGSI